MGDLLYRIHGSKKLKSSIRIALRQKISEIFVSETNLTSKKIRKLVIEIETVRVYYAFYVLIQYHVKV